MKFVQKIFDNSQLYADKGQMLPRPMEKSMLFIVKYGSFVSFLRVCGAVNNPFRSNQLITIVSPRNRHPPSNSSKQFE